MVKPWLWCPSHWWALNNRWQQCCAAVPCDRPSWRCGHSVLLQAHASTATAIPAADGRIINPHSIPHLCASLAIRCLAPWAVLQRWTYSAVPHTDQWPPHYRLGSLYGFQWWLQTASTIVVMPIMPCNGCYLHGYNCIGYNEPRSLMISVYMVITSVWGQICTESW